MLSRLVPALLLPAAALAHAVEETEPPVEANVMGIVLFFVVAAACIGLYVWYTVKNEKKSTKEKNGEAF